MTAMVLLSEWMKSQVEFWRPVPRYPDYDVSSFGRVRSWRTIRPLGNHGGTESARRKSPRLMSPHVPKAGYPIVALGRTMKENKGKALAVHRIVALAFLPNPDRLPSVNHLTGLKTDNRLDGLKWASWSEQSKHAWEFGLHKRDRFAVSKKMVDARRPYRPVSDDTVRMIRNMLADGISQGQIRRWSGLKYTTIQSIAVRRTYQDVT
jgi:NUMOD4 motif-containing protein